MSFCRTKTKNSIKSNIIPCRFSVMEALLRKYDILNLCRFQLPRKIPPAHTSVAPKLVMMWPQVCSLSDQNHEIIQISCLSLPILSDGSRTKEVRNDQPLQIPTAKKDITSPHLCGSETRNDVGTSMFFVGTKQLNNSNPMCFLADSQ
jgi:hypothetical protein